MAKAVMAFSAKELVTKAECMAKAIAIAKVTTATIFWQEWDFMICLSMPERSIEEYF